MTVSRSLRSLPIVLPTDQLEGQAPVAFERAARQARAGDATHLGLTAIACTIARFTLAGAAPPGARKPVLDALVTLDEWLRGTGSEHAVKKARSDAFAAAPWVEERTLDAVRASLGTQKQHTAIDAHADAVVLRYVGLGAYYAVSACVLALDTASDPAAAIGVPRQAAGALAYQQSGLGLGRSQTVRARALEQASWEAERPGAPAGHGEEALAIQLFHEFLGAHWKDHSDAQRAYFADFITWALPARLRPS